MWTKTKRKWIFGCVCFKRNLQTKQTNESFFLFSHIIRFGRIIVFIYGGNSNKIHWKSCHLIIWFLVWTKKSLALIYLTVCCWKKRILWPFWFVMKTILTVVVCLGCFFFFKNFVIWNFQTKKKNRRKFQSKNWSENFSGLTERNNHY